MTNKYVWVVRYSKYSNVECFTNKKSAFEFVKCNGYTLYNNFVDYHTFTHPKDVTDYVSIIKREYRK